ncbi:MAG TPA: 16S rRNA (cytosine(1402)-N(4))-methyltransferase RsmH [Candidatus Paceibacterota bacterium]|nr:16S rRNA (cytosine(1402)-N(4))-methyltransferase RsmH [Candidatus Paceibacterota bacterium]
MAQHVSVMLERCIELLAPAIERSESPVVVDATLGLGGHTEALLTKYSNLSVIGIDRDAEAIELAKSRLHSFGDRFKPIHAIYDDIQNCIEYFGYSKVNGILFDLGISSMQVDEAARGFSYSQDAPLDMRMDRSQGRTAADLVNYASRDELILILRKYGEERFAPRIVDSILRRRAISPLNSTAELAAIVKESIPAATRRTGGNPAKRTFQALRIAVNDELEVLTRAIPASMNALSVGGRLVVMSFQSLEDRIVKNFFSAATQSLTPRELPVEIPELAAKFKLVVKSSETPSANELTENSRSQSVRLRAIERLAA